MGDDPLRHMVLRGKYKRRLDYGFMDKSGTNSRKIRRSCRRNFDYMATYMTKGKLFLEKGKSEEMQRALGRLCFSGRKMETLDDVKIGQLCE